jgi:hypothetical protein
MLGMELNTGEQIFNHVKTNSKNKCETTAILSTLTPIQKAEYKRYCTSLRQRKYYQNHKEGVQERNREMFKKYVAADPEKWKELNKKHQTAYNEREKAKLLEAQRQLEEKRKHDEAQKIASEIVNELVDNTVLESKKKKKREYMREYRRRKASVEK